MSEVDEAAIVDILDAIVGTTSPLSVSEFAANLADESKLETARKVYKAVCGKAPDTDPLPMLVERWW